MANEVSGGSGEGRSPGMSRVVVGFMGAKRAGKDTAATALRAIAMLQGVPADRRSFADALKAEYARHLGVTVFELEARKEEHRAGLQAWGMARRRDNPRYWIDQVRLPERGVVTVTDVRLANEIEWVQAEHDGVLVRVERAAVEQASLDDPHVSEHEWRSAEPDFVLKNNGSEMHLQREVRRLWTLWVKGKVGRH